IRWSEGVTIRISSGFAANAAKAIAAAVLRGTASTIISCDTGARSSFARSIFLTDPTSMTCWQTFWFRSIVNAKSDLLINIVSYCFGFDFRDKGHNLDPTPPERITLIVLSINISLLVVIRGGNAAQSTSP